VNASRYEHASLILTSNLAFSGRGGVFGDQAVAAAMIDRVVHHADVLTLKGASYRLRNRGIDTLPSIPTQDTADENRRTDGPDFERRNGLADTCGPPAAAAGRELHRHPTPEGSRAGRHTPAQALDREAQSGGSNRSRDHTRPSAETRQLMRSEAARGGRARGQTAPHDDNRFRTFSQVMGVLRSSAGAVRPRPVR
jgi:IstB-like ATP binding protein